MKNVRISSVEKLDYLGEAHLTLTGPGDGYTVHLPAEEYMKEYLRVIMENGGLLNYRQAAKFAGVSTARIGQLVKAGKLRLVTLSVATPSGPMLIDETITGNDLRAWMAAPKTKGGRPTHRARQTELQAA